MPAKDLAEARAICRDVANVLEADVAELLRLAEEFAVDGEGGRGRTARRIADEGEVQAERLRNV